MKIIRVIVNLSFIVGLSLIGALSFTAGYYWSENGEGDNYELKTAESLWQGKFEEAEKIAGECQEAYADSEKVNGELRSELTRLKMQTTPTVRQAQPTSPPSKTVVTSNFTGDDLWQAVNKYRKEHGVPELRLQGNLCELSSKRLGELLALGSLDNHEGFERYFENHDVSDLGVNNVAENLASGYPGAWETVMGWDSSPGHKTFLLADGAYVWGCASANQGYAVLIGGY